MRRYALLLIVLTGVALLAAPPLPSWLSSALHSLSPILLSRPAGNDALAFRTAAVERGELVATVRAAGTFNALVLVEVGSQISGQIKELYVDFNSTVTEGQLIARIEPETYEAKVAQEDPPNSSLVFLLLVHHVAICALIRESEVAWESESTFIAAARRIIAR
jgi:HlyD family secretion protein